MEVSPVTIAGLFVTFVGIWVMDPQELGLLEQAGLILIVLGLCLTCYGFQQ